MQFVDLKTQFMRLEENINNRLSQVFAHGQFIMGPEVKELEQRLAQYVGAKHCVSLSSGTDALLISLMAVGIAPGDEIITTPFSFIATASMIKLLGAVPVFVDIDPKTYNLDPQLIEQAITPKTKAILPVSLYGQCADFDQIKLIADKYNLPVIEDAAQSFGATYKGRYSCSSALSTIAATSFYPSKPLGCYGDGGACFTDDDELATHMRHIRNHGQDRSYHHIRLGINGRIDTLQAAILLTKLDVFPEELQARRRIAQEYNRLLSEEVVTPYIELHNQSTYAQYTILVENRSQVIEHLTNQGIPTAVHYPIPIHQQPLMAQECQHYSLPHAEAAACGVLSLPFHPYLQSTEMQDICEKIIEAVQSYRECA